MTRLVQRIIAERRRAVIGLGAGLLLNGAAFAGLVYPLARRVDTAEQRAAAAKQSLASAQQLNANARATVAGKARANQELRQFYDEVLPANFRGARRITYLRLDQLARQAGLRSEQGNMQEDKERKSLLRRMSAKLILEGEYEDVRQFIHQLETAPEFVVIEEVALKQPEGKGPLVLTMAIATYYRPAADGS